MSRHLHIVSFDVPFPANYGGVIDVYWKLYWLKQAGIQIHLHCFTYGRLPAKELENLCTEVFYYKRKTGLLSNFSLLPYNVRSRQSEELAQNLLKDDFPILFEVLHTCSLLADPRFKNRKKIYRHSNIEHDYYRGLARSERSFFKKIYLRIEALKLKDFEKIVQNAQLILAVNQKDTDYFMVHYPAVRSVFIPSFHPDIKKGVKTEREDYILFHGNLSVSENSDAAMWLTREVFSKINEKVIIAGLNPPATLIQFFKKYPHIELRISPDESEMDELIAKAKLHVLYTAQATGLKLKLLNVLFKGGFVLCNRAMLTGTGLNESALVFTAEDGPEFIQKIALLDLENFSDEMRMEREEALQNFKNENNVQKLLNLVFE